MSSFSALLPILIYFVSVATGEQFHLPTYSDLLWLFPQQLRLTSRWCLLLVLAAVRFVFTLTEQPGGSIMRHFPYLDHVSEIIKKLGGEWQETYLCLTSIQS